MLTDRGNVLAEALGQAHAADVEALAHVRADDLHFGRAAADVDDERPGLERADPAQRHRGLLVAAQHARLEPVAPLDLTEEGLAVLRVAHGARRDAERPLRSERLELAPIRGEDVADARDRDGEEAAPLVDALAEPGDLEPADDLCQRPVRVGDEQPGRVRPEVDRSDPHLRGYTAVTRPIESRTSSIALVSTFSRARERRSWASSASSLSPLSAASVRCRSISPLARSIRSSPSATSPLSLLAPRKASRPLSVT